MPTFDEILYDLERSLVSERGLTPVEASQIVEALRADPAALNGPRVRSTPWHPPFGLPDLSRLAAPMLGPINTAIDGALNLSQEYQSRASEIVRSLGLDSVTVVPESERDEFMVELLDQAARDPDFTVLGNDMTFAIDRMEGVNVGDPFVQNGVTLGQIVAQTPSYTMISLAPTAQPEVSLLQLGRRMDVSMGTKSPEPAPDPKTRFNREDPL